MIRQIMIEAESPDDAQSMFRLSIDTNLIARGVTGAQVRYLVGEVLERVGFPERAETAMFDADGGAEESVSLPEMEVESLEERASGLLKARSPA
jgi:hypothetical protein